MTTRQATSGCLCVRPRWPPFYEWSREEVPFPLTQALSAWGITDGGSTDGEEEATLPTNEGAPLTIEDEDIPF